MGKKHFIIWIFLCLIINTKAQGTHWLVNIYDYQYDMTAYVALTADGNAVTDYGNYEVAAFCGSECRGVATIRTAGGKTYGYLRIRSNQQEGEIITFKVYVKDVGREIDVNDYSVTFESQSVKGLPSSPVVLDFIPYILGDVDNSGEVDIFDAVAVVEYYLNGAYDGFNVKAADFNGDGNVDIFDAVAIVDHYQNQ